MSDPFPLAPWLRDIVGTFQPPTPEMDAPAIQDELEARAERHRLLEQSIHGDRRWASFESDLLVQRVQPASAVELGRRAVGSPRVVLVGPSGIGKTSLAVAILRARATRQAVQGRVILAHRLGLARSQHRLGDGEALLVEQAMGLPLLLLDSVGQDDSARGIEVCRDVVVERFAEQRSTIVTLDLTIEQTAAKFGDGFARRLFERATVIKLGAGR